MGLRFAASPCLRKRFQSTHGAILHLRFNSLLAAFAFYFGGVGTVPGAPDVTIVSPDQTSSVNGEGVVVVAWETDPPGGDVTYELEQADDPSFARARTRYAGPDQASVLTGFREGTVHFRVRAISTGNAVGEWSEPVVVEIDYMSRSHVVTLLAVGALVFAATVGTLLGGHFRTSSAI